MAVAHHATPSRGWIVFGFLSRFYLLSLLIATDARGIDFSTLANRDPLTARIGREQDTEYRLNTEVLSIEAKSLVSQLRPRRDDRAPAIEEFLPPRHTI